MQRQTPEAQFTYHRQLWASVCSLRLPLACVLAAEVGLLWFSTLPQYVSALLLCSLIFGLHAQFTAWRLALDVQLFNLLDQGAPLVQLDTALSDHGITKPINRPLKDRVAGTARLWRYSLLGFGIQIVCLLAGITGKVVAQALYN